MKGIKYAAATILGLAAALAALELGLRAYAALQYRPGHELNSSVSAKIICAGDSFTYGLGASARGKDYPGQLNELFRKAGGEYSVLNAGVPGTNSALMLRRLPQTLEDNHAAAVIIMSGSNNNWNLQAAWGLEDSPLKAKVKAALFRLSIYKFYAYASRNLHRGANPVQSKAPARPGEDEALAALTNRDFAKAEKLYSALRAKDRTDGYAWAGLSNTYFAQDKNKQALLTAMDGLKTAKTGRYKLHYNLGKYFFLQWHTRSAPDGNYLSATHWFEQAASGAAAAGDSETAQRTLWDLCSSYRSAGEQKRGLAFLASLSLPDADKRIFNAFLKTDDLNSKIQNWLTHDLGAAAELCRSHGAKLFLANFPDQPGYSDLNTQLKMLAAQLGAPLIDNAAMFARLRAARPEGFDAKYFVSDGHCNDAGYALMAENAYSVLAEHGFKQDAAIVAPAKQALQ